MEALLNEADALILTAGENGPAKPDFEIPEEYVPFTVPQENILQIRDNNPNKKGKGFFASQDIPAGSILLVAKPVAWTLDSEEEELLLEDDMEEDEEEEDVEDESQEQQFVNELLLLQLLQAIKENPSIWLNQVSQLYPRDAVDIQASPAWRSKKDEIVAQFHKLIQELETIPQLVGKSNEISQRLPLIIRYNVLSIETCPELLSYPGPTGHVPLAGVGLYHWPSFFNHDSRPNVSRYAIGDVMWFVANQHITAGQEACISYLEHDVLCETAHRRNGMLTLDFKEAISDDNDKEDVPALDGPSIPVVDSEVQNELMSMSPFERLDSIEELMKQATGEAQPEGDEEEEDGMMEANNGEVWFECDLQNLRILKAMTIEAMGQSKPALQLWEQCVQFAETRMPPNDESSVVIRVQAALCAWNAGEESRAREHAAKALQVHALLFGGGGVQRLRRRYQKEFCLNIRKESRSKNDGKLIHDILWPHTL